MEYVKHMDGNFQPNKKDTNGIKHMNRISIESKDHEWNKTHGRKFKSIRKSMNGLKTWMENFH